MIRFALSIAGLLLVAPAMADPIAGAIAAPTRPASDVALDTGRKPAEMLAMLDVAPGQRLLDFIAGRGYYARLAAPVVGGNGQVVALMTPGLMKLEGMAGDWERLKAAHPNVTLVTGIPGEMALPDRLDRAMFHLTYHDLYWESAKFEVPRMEPARFLTQLHAAMVPGGKLLVIDHVGAAGVDPRVEADRTHRIDPAVVRADFEKAGFRFLRESTLLANSTDNPATLVFDAAVRNRTNRFAWLFERP
jgi:predicted methyltransferase